MGQPGFFDLGERYRGLDAKKDPLVVLDAVWASPLGVALPQFAWIEGVGAEVWRVTHRTP